MRPIPSRRPLRRLFGLVALVLLFGSAVQFMQRKPPARLEPRVAAAVRPGDIRMIASVGCVYCGAARAWFADNQLPFSECLIERDTACAAAYDTLRAPGTPVLLVRGQRIVGFDPKAVAKVLTETS